MACSFVSSFGLFWLGLRLQAAATHDLPLAGEEQKKAKVEQARHLN
jgi:hypothetical protein